MSDSDDHKNLQSLHYLFVLVAIGFIVFGVGIGFILFNQSQRTDALVTEAEETTRLLELIAADEPPLAVTFPNQITINDVDRESVSMSSTLCRANDDVVEVRIRVTRRFIETGESRELSTDVYPGLRDNHIFRFTDLAPCRTVNRTVALPDALINELGDNPDATPLMMISLDVSPLLQSSDTGGSTFFSAREISTISESFRIPSSS